MSEIAEIEKSKAREEAEKKGWERPFEILVKMKPEERDNIRDTLDFSWAKKTINCEETDIKSEFEAWEIIDCNIRGIAARLHTISEQLNPTKYLSWRKALVRTLQTGGFNFKPTENEEELEKRILDIYDKKDRLTFKKKRNEYSLAMVSKLDKKAAIASSIVKEGANMWDDVFGSEDDPAMLTIYAICSCIHLQAGE